MDTGSIMENQMSDLIDQGIALQDEIVEQALKVYKEHKIMPEQLLEIVKRVKATGGKNLTEELTNFRIIQNNINEIFLIIDDKYGTSKITEPKALIIQRVINWVAVKDSLPEHNKKVQFYGRLYNHNKREVYTGILNRAGRLNEWNSGGRIMTDVTYWGEIKPPCL